MIQGLICDIDGTIYRNKEVSQTDFDSLQSYAQTNQLVFATGRNYFMFQRFIERYPISFAYAVLCNGALIINQDNQIIYSQTFRTLDFLDLFNHLFGPRTLEKISLSFNSDKQNYYFPEVSLDDYFSLTTLPKKLNGACIEVCSIEEANDLSQKIKKSALLTNLSFQQNKQFLDFSPLAITKGTAISYLYPENQSQLAVVGDDLNDCSMFEITPHSFALSDGNDLLQKKARTIVHTISEVVTMIR